MNDTFTTERDFHSAFEKWLRSEGILFVTSRMDRAATQEEGEPDYLIIRAGHVLPIELKQPKTGRLSTAQVFRHSGYALAGTPVHVLKSLADAIELVCAWRDTLPPISAPQNAAAAQHGHRLTIRQHGQNGDWVFDNGQPLRRALLADLSVYPRTL